MKIRGLDADADTDDLIDTWIIEVPTLLPTFEWSDFTPYTGTTSNNAQITLRYRLRCRGNWHGHNCNIRCVDVDTDSAHLECALDGSHVCMDGWQDLSTDCTVRELSSTVYTDMVYGILVVHGHAYQAHTKLLMWLYTCIG